MSIFDEIRTKNSEQYIPPNKDPYEELALDVVARGLFDASRWKGRTKAEKRTRGLTKNDPIQALEWFFSDSTEERSVLWWLGYGLDNPVPAQKLLIKFLQELGGRPITIFHARRVVKYIFRRT